MGVQRFDNRRSLPNNTCLQLADAVVAQPRDFQLQLYSVKILNELCT